MLLSPMVNADLKYLFSSHEDDAKCPQKQTYKIPENQTDTETINKKKKQSRR